MIFVYCIRSDRVHLNWKIAKDSVRKKWLMTFSACGKFIVLRSNALPVRWLSRELRAAIKWRVITAEHTFAIVVIRRLMDMITSGWYRLLHIWAQFMTLGFCFVYFLEEHFSCWRDGKCELFPPEAIQMWEERINARQVIGQIQAQMLPNRAHPCPNCRQMNVKVR